MSDVTGLINPPVFVCFQYFLIFQLSNIFIYHDNKKESFSSQVLMCLGKLLFRTLKFQVKIIFKFAYILFTNKIYVKRKKKETDFNT